MLVIRVNIKSVDRLQNSRFVTLFLKKRNKEERFNYLCCVPFYKFTIWEDDLYIHFDGFDSICDRENIGRDLAFGFYIFTKMSSHFLKIPCYVFLLYIILLLCMSIASKFIFYQIIHSLIAKISSIIFNIIIIIVIRTKKNLIF